MSLRLAGPAGLAAALVLSSVALAGCGGGSDNPLASGSSSAGGASASGGSGSMVVGSADFSESVLLAELYAGALNKAGIKASTKPRIGSREIYIKALQDGSIQAVPEYTGNLGRYFKPDFVESDPQAAYDKLKTIVPAELTVAAKAAAEDKDSLTVTKETADKLHATKISDLSASAKDLVLGGPDEFKTRPQGVPALQKTYGLTFKQVRTPLAGQAAVTALKNDQIQVANIFTTDPAIKANNFVVLQDDKGIFGTQNVVPLLTKAAAKPEAIKALDGVSAKLTTDALLDMMGKVDLEHKDAATVAHDWLSANGLA